MQETPTTSTLGNNLLTFLAWFLSGSFITSVVTWLMNRRKTSAEVLEIHATATKIEFEAHEASTRTILAAQARIVELVDINADLQAELSEVGRQRDNAEFDSRDLEFRLGQVQGELAMAQHFIEQLQSASKLGVKLSELPPAKESHEQ